MSAPSWWDYITGTTEAAADAYRRGWLSGYRQRGEDDAQAAQEAQRAALVARAGVECIDVARARQEAARRAQEIAAGWSA